MNVFLGCTATKLDEDKYGDSGLGYIKQFYHDTVGKDIEKIKEKIDELYESLFTLNNINSDLYSIFHYLNTLKN